MRRAALASLVLAAGCGGDLPRPPAPPTGGAPWFEEAAAARGIDFAHVSGHADDYLMPEIMGGGAALADLDGDGDLDAYLVQSGNLPATGDGPPNRLFENGGGGSFADATEGSGADHRGYGMGVACGDFDDDGLTDLLVTNVGPNVLLRNGGDLRFADATEAAGLGHAGWGTSAAFLDHDRDGRLDLFVVNYLDWRFANELPCRNNQSGRDYCSPKVYKLPSTDLLYTNRGDGSFADVSAASGVGAAPGTGLGVGCGDFDDDGWIDVFVANDGMPDFLWNNLGDGRFEDVGALSGCAVDVNGAPKAGMGVALGDVDRDLDLDLLVCNLNRESDSLYLNEGGYFSDRTASLGLGAVSKPFTRFGMAWVDLDHDGFLDLFQANGRVQAQPRLWSPDPYAEPNLVFRGLPTGEGKGFAEVLPRGGTEPALVGTSRAAAFGDVDGDGDVDVLVVNRDGPAHLLLNLVGGRGSWLFLRVLETSGRDAIGATVELSVGPTRLRRDVRAAYSYLASNDPRVHLGLGAAEAAEEVVVRWADGEREAFGTLSAGREHVLRRGEGSPP